MLDYFKYLQETNTHRAIGQEYDNVVMYIDDNFFYGNDKELWSKVHPNPNFLYDKLLFQGVTRVREKLAIVVISNQDVYSKLLGIIYENDYDNS